MYKVYIFQCVGMRDLDLFIDYDPNSKFSLLELVSVAAAPRISRCEIRLSLPFGRLFGSLFGLA